METFRSAECFSSLLTALMGELGIQSYTDLQNRLQLKGFEQIDKRRISEYCHGVTTPSFEKAKALLHALDYYDITDEEILHSLRENRKYSKLQKEECVLDGNRELRISLRLKLEKFIPGKNYYEIQRYLRERMLDLLGEESYTDYLSLLIEKDLQEFILHSENTNTSLEEINV